MDLDDFRLILRESGVDLWTFLDAAIALASLDCGSELKSRRDGIVERLYSTACGKCEKIESEPRRSDIWEPEEVNKPRDENLSEERARFDRELKEDSPETPRSIDGEEGDLDGRYGAEIDREQSRILAIKEQIEDPDQTEDSLINLLQNLADMDITFKVLKETDIGRHMTGLRKHTSSEVRRLAKQLIRKWKDIVDEWVKANTPSQVAAAALIADGDSPQQFQVKHHQNENQVADYSYSPNHHNGNSSIDRHKQKVEPKERPMPRREVETKQKQVAAAYTTNKSNEPKESAIDMERLASARKRLHENYKEAENAKKQRTIQVMDLQDIPKSKNSFIARNKGGFHGRHG